MKKCMFILLMCLVLMSSTCDREDNHYYITIKNQSDNDIELAMHGSYPAYNKCFLWPLHTLEKHSVFEWSPFNSSIERNLGGNSVLELYFVNPNKFNVTDFYDCDSIFIKNDVLKHYRLTLEDLQRCNFTITYP